MNLRRKLGLFLLVFTIFVMVLDLVSPAVDVPTINLVLAFIISALVIGANNGDN